MSRDKSVWFAEEILLDAKLINFQLETGEWDAVEEMLRAEAQLSRDSETGKLRPKKASEYTLRLIAEVLHIMRLDIEQAMYNLSTLAVAEQCLRLIRSCAASGMKIQTYISKDLSILDDMLMICTKYQHPNGEFVNEEIVKKYESCMIILVQTLGNLVVNNPFNQIIIWDKFGATIIDCLIGNNEKIASSAAMIVYNILLGQPNILPDDVLLLNSLTFMYSTGNSEFPHLIIEYLVGVENSYIEKLYNRLEADTKLLILNLAYNILMFNETQDINVSVNFIKFIAHEFKVKSDCILKTVDKYVNSIEPQEVVYLLDIIATASSMDAYLDCLQNDVSLFINCAFLLRLIHKIGKESNNFFSSINKLYDMVGKTVPPEVTIEEVPAIEKDLEATPSTESLKKNDSAENMLQCHEAISCTESESSEQYYECNDQFPYLDKIEAQNTVETLQPQLKFVEAPMDTKAHSEGKIRETISGNVTIDDQLNKVSFVKTLESVSEDVSEKVPEADESLILNMVEPGSGSQSRKDSVELQKTYIDDEPPLIIDEHPLNNNQSRRNSADNQESSTVGDIPTNSPSGNQSRKNSIENQVSDIPVSHNETTMATDESPVQENVMISSIHSDTENLQINVDLNQKTVAEVPIMQPLDSSATSQLTKPVTSPFDATAVKEVKRSQNLSTDFDLSEQLQKILGISADKALKAEIGDTNKEKLQPIIKEVKIAEAPVQVKLPLVKIDSPESAQKQKLGSVDQSKPKKVRTMVESVEQHVAFGFKASLIRTLGNLCWKNQINKRQIRELEVIPVLLDCCNIDARNPLITQWVIFAVRNLCENCPENQSVIASLSLKRAVDNEMLSEMGLTLHTDAQNNTIKLVPLPKN